MSCRPRSLGSIVAAAFVFATAAAACSSSSTTAPGPVATSTASGVAAPPAAGRTTFVAEVWADNWFSLTVNGVLVGQDSVPITTERSFNAESISFEAEYPLTIAMVTKDYKANDSGLEYIGTARQQMGDGGFIAQIKQKATGRLVVATGTSWRGLVVHRAPLNPSCERSANPLTDCRFEALAEPSGWTLPGFDDRSWTPAVAYTTQQVGTKEGYDTIKWAPSAALIWSADLKVDNTILWRVSVG